MLVENLAQHKMPQSCLGPDGMLRLLQCKNNILTSLVIQHSLSFLFSKLSFFLFLSFISFLIGMCRTAFWSVCPFYVKPTFFHSFCKYLQSPPKEFVRFQNGSMIDGFAMVLWGFSRFCDGFMRNCEVP